MEKGDTAEFQQPRRRVPTYKPSPYLLDQLVYLNDDFFTLTASTISDVHSRSLDR